MLCCIVCRPWKLDKVDFEFPQDASNPELTAILGGDFDLLLSSKPLGA